MKAKRIIATVILLVLFVPAVITASDVLNVSVSVSLDTGLFSGSVRDVNDVLIANASVTALGTAHSTAATAGNYDIIGIPAGSYSLQASASGYLSQTKTNQLIVSGATTTVNFVLSPTGGIRGSIVDFWTGNGINNANVTLGQFGSDIGSTLTNAAGDYEFTDLAPGYYDVSVAAAGYTSNSKPNNQVIGGQDSAINFWLW